MENNEQKPITQEELVATLLKFSDEILFPAMQTMSDETNQRIDDLKQEITQEITGINGRLDEHETLIYRLIENGEKTDRRLNSIEKKIDNLIKVENEDVCALGEDTVKIKKMLQNHELRLQRLGV